MNRTLGFLAALSAAACSIEPGAGRPAPKGKDPLNVDGAGQEISLDATRVPVVPACDSGQLVRKTADGWECADASGLRVAWESVTGKPTTTPWSQITVPGTTVWPGRVLLDRVDGATEALENLNTALLQRIARLDAETLELNVPVSASSRPACVASRRGTFWMRAGGTGTGDDLEVCAKDGADVYAWRPLVRTCNKVQKGGLEAYLKFDGDYADASGNNMNGVVQYGQLAPTFVPGKFGQAVSLNLNNTGQYVNLPGSTGLHMTGGLTIAAWVKFSLADVQSTYNAIVGKHTSGVASGYILSIAPPGKPSFYGPETLYATTAVGADAWRFVAGAWNPPVEAVYVDGQVVATMTSAISIGTNSNSVTVGALSNAVTPFKGTIDELTLWSRSLSELEIQDLMSCGPLP